MRFVELSDYNLNLEYMIMTENAPQGVLRVTMDAGRVIDLADEDARKVRAAIRDTVAARAGPVVRLPVPGAAVDPAGGGRSVAPVTVPDLARADDEAV